MTAAAKPRKAPPRKNSSMKGMYRPIYPEKYMGDPRKIRFMSSWEFRFMTFCDKNPNIIKWGSEELRIKYMHPIKKKICEYIPDFILKYKNKDGELITEIVEIKPRKQTVISTKMSRYDQVQLVINNAKWTAAQAFCLKHGIKFRVLTEQEMFR